MLGHIKKSFQILGGWVEPTERALNTPLPVEFINYYAIIFVVFIIMNGVVVTDCKYGHLDEWELWWLWWFVCSLLWPRIFFFTGIEC